MRSMAWSPVQPSSFSFRFLGASNIITSLSRCRMHDDFGGPLRNPGPELLPGFETTM